MKGPCHGRHRKEGVCQCLPVWTPARGRCKKCGGSRARHPSRASVSLPWGPGRPGRRGASQVGHGVEGGWAWPRCPSPLLKALLFMGQVPTLAFARLRGRLVLVRTSGGQRLMWHPAKQPVSAFPSSGGTQSLPQGMTPSTDRPCRPKALWSHVQPASPTPSY